MNDQILPPTSGNTQAPPSNFFEALVGEDKKFKDPEALAKAKWTSDEYIKTLESKLDNATADIRTLTEKMNQQANMQELIDQVNQRPQATSTQPLPPQPPADNKPNIDPNKLLELVDQRVKAIDMQKVEGDNLKKVQEKIKEKWGENVPASVREQIGKLGELGTQMAKRHPDEFLRTIGAETTQRQPNYLNPPRSGLNADTLRPQGEQERTWAWYEDLRKKDPNLYYSKKMSVQMHNDTIRLGERFTDGDFSADDKDLLRTKYINS